MSRGNFRWSTIAKKLKRFSYTIIFLFLALPLRAQVADSSGNFTWKPVRIGAGGFVSGMSFSPNNESGIVARTDVGNAYLYNGSSWTPLRVHNADGTGVQSFGDFGAPALQGILSAVVDPGNSQHILLAFKSQHSNDVQNSTPNQGVNVYYSSDGGQNFNASNLSLDGNANDGTGNLRYAGERLAIDPNNSSVAYYGSTDAGLYRSIDGGATFSLVTGSNAPGGNVSNVLFAVNGGTTNAYALQNPLSSTVYAVQYNGDVFQSLNAGQDWTNISTGTGLSGRANFTTIDNQGNLYVSDGGKDYWIYSSGAFTEVTIPNFSSSLQDVVADPSNDPNNPSANRFYAVSNGGDFYRSTDNGADWTSFGKFRFAPSSIAWLPQTIGTQTDTFKLTSGIFFDANGNLWAAEGNEGTLEYTPPARGSDTGDTPQWTIRSQGIEELVATGVVVPPGSGDTIIATVQDATGYVIPNPDNFTAQQIALQQNLLSEGLGVAYVPDNPASIFISSSDIYDTSLPNYSGYSFNTGASGSWSLFGSSYTYPNGTPAQAGSLAVSARGGSISAGSDHIVITPIFNHIPEWSNDGGRTWDQASSSFPADPGDSSLLASGYGTYFNQGVFPNQLQADPFTPDTFYLQLGTTPSGDNNTFYVSTNGGQNWTAQNSGLPSGTANGVLATNRKVQGDLWFVDGYQGGGAHGLWHGTADPSNSGVVIFNYVSGFSHAIQVTLGAQTPGGNANYTVYVYGQRTDDDKGYGVFRSTDGGGTFDRISYYPTGIYDWPTAMAASWDNPGKVYIGFSGNSFVYSQPSSGPTTPPSDTITSVNWPQSIPPTGPATATVQYSVGSSRTLTVYLWDSNYNWKGQTSQSVSGNGSATITVSANSSITTGVAFMRAVLQNGSTALAQLENDNITVGSTATDTITSVSWPTSVPAAGPATATVNYSANSGRMLTVYLWDSNYNWKGQTSQTVSGNGSATITVPANSSITTGVAYMRALLQDGSSTLSQLDNDNIPVQ